MMSMKRVAVLVHMMCDVSKEVVPYAPYLPYPAGAK